MLLTAGAGWYAATTIGVTTDTTEMLSPELEFRKDLARYRATFPEYARQLVVVVEGSNPDRVDDAALALHAALAARNDLFLSAFYPQAEPFLRRNGLLYLGERELTDLSARLATAQPLLATLSRDASLRGLFDVLGVAIDALGTRDGQEEQLGVALDHFLASIEAAAEARSVPVSWQRLIHGTPRTGGVERRLIVLQPVIDFSRLTAGVGAMEHVRSEAARLGLTADTGARVRLTGPVALDAEELESVSRGAGIAGLISLVLVSVLLVLGLRSVWPVVAVIATLVCGLILTAGFAALAVGSLNLISVAFAVLFIGLGVDFGIHFTLRYREESVDGGGPAALERAGRGVGSALTLTAVAAAAAFLSFLPTDYRGVAELGLIAGAGMAIALFLSLTLLPALLALRPLRPQSAARNKRALRRMVAAEGWVVRNGRTVTIAGIALGLLAMASIPFVAFDRSALNLKDQGTESVRTAADLIRDHERGGDAITVLAADMEAVPALARKLRAVPSVGSVQTVDDFVPVDQEVKLEIVDDISLLLTPVLAETPKPPPTSSERLGSAERLAGRARAAVEEGRAGGLEARLQRLASAIETIVAHPDRDAVLKRLDGDLIGGFSGRLELLREALEAGPVSLADVPERIKRRFVATDGTALLRVLPRDDIRDGAALRRFVEDVRDVAPQATGGPVVELAAGDVVIRAFALATGIALVVITLLLVLVLRRPLEVLLVLAPLLLAGLLTLAVSVIADRPFNFANIIVLPLLLGLGAASGIHIVLRFRSGGALMTTSTPRAVLFSALTTVASFGSLSISSHAGTASMGTLLTTAIGLTLICSLVFLPALLAWVGHVDMTSVDRRRSR